MTVFILHPNTIKTKTNGGVVMCLLADQGVDSRKNLSYRNLQSTEKKRSE